MNKITITLTMMIFSTFAMANERPLGRIVDVKGSSFIYYNGKTVEAKKGDFLYPKSEIIVEMTGQVSFTDNADHRFHLSSSSSVVVDVTKIELRSGELWLQSLNTTDNYALETANARVDYTAGEAVLSYDQNKSKSQLLVVNGLMKFTNRLMAEFDLHVGEGNFSFIEAQFEGGRPRTPTLVGNKTYNMAISSFAGISPMNKDAFEIFNKNDAILTEEKPRAQTQTRYIASIEEEAPIKIEDQRKKSDTLKTIDNKTKKVVKEAPQKTVSSNLEVKIYGLKDFDTNFKFSTIYDWNLTTTLPEKSQALPRVRMPASAPVQEMEIGTTVDAFENSTTKHEYSAPVEFIQYRENDILLQRLQSVETK